MAALVGEPARDAYRRETGYRPLVAAVDPGAELSPSMLMGMVDSIRSLVGAEAFDALRTTHLKGRNSRTPPRRGHRLMLLTEHVLDLAAKMAGEARWNAPVWPVTELHGVLGVLDRWQRHPAWTHLRAALLSEFPHTIAHLTVASYLVDVGNGVGIGQPNAQTGSKVPDLWIQADVCRRLDIEVKAPVDLQGPRAGVTFSEAEEIVKRYLDKTVKGSKGQLSGREGLLALGGFSLQREDLKVLEAGALSVLATRGHRHQQFVGIVTASMGFTPDKAGRGVSPSMETRMALHPGYAGGLTVDRTPLEQLKSQLSFDVP